jgi:putative metallohydrolase (TIGR04338 family)
MSDGLDELRSMLDLSGPSKTGSTRVRYRDGKRRMPTETNKHGDRVYGVYGAPRDSQRSKVYRAEGVLKHHRTKTFKVGGKTWSGATYADLKDVKAYVDKLVGSAWFKRRWPNVRSVEVNDGRGRQSAGGEGGWRRQITLPRHMRRQEIVLHELAHVLTDAEFGRKNAAPHGREFARTLLTLVRHEMGDEAWRALKDSFRTHKVKHTLRRNREYTPEQKAEAAERLAAARAAKASKVS